MISIVANNTTTFSGSRGRWPIYGPPVSGRYERLLARVWMFRPLWCALESRTADRTQLFAVMKKGVNQLNDKRYRTIMADPPWDVQQKGKNSLGAERHYDLMTLDQIKAMPIAELADPESSHCWLWVTNATLRHGYDVLEAWGFTPRSPLTWIKPRFTLGRYLRNATEHILLGTRGKAPVQFRSQPTWMFAPLQDHSHKPEEQYAVIERVSPGPYLELFARRPRPGWDVWGNQIASDIDIPGYPVPDSPSTRRRS